MSYSNSTALSIEHFKLINSLEDLNDKSKVNEKQQEQIILNEQINKIKGRLNKTSISTVSSYFNSPSSFFSANNLLIQLWNSVSN